MRAFTSRGRVTYDWIMGCHVRVSLDSCSARGGRLTGGGERRELGLALCGLAEAIELVGRASSSTQGFSLTLHFLPRELYKMS